MRRQAPGTSGGGGVGGAAGGRLPRWSGPRLPAGASLPRQPLLPGRPVRWPWVVLALLLVGVLVVKLWPFTGEPRDLQEAVLVGPRGPGCVRLIIMPDVTGSMAQYASARQAATAAMLGWAPANLRSDDQLMVVDWGADAVTALPVTGVAQTVGDQVGTAAVDGTTTQLLPAIGQVAAAPTSRCRAVAALISDGILNGAESKQQLLDAWQQAGVDQVWLLRPSQELDVPPSWQQVAPYASTAAFDGLDAGATGLALGEVLAQATGQHLERG